MSAPALDLDDALTEATRAWHWLHNALLRPRRPANLDELAKAMDDAMTEVARAGLRERETRALRPTPTPTDDA